MVKVDGGDAPTGPGCFLDPSARTLVREVLGCTCPDEVLEDIKYTIHPVEGYGLMLDVGGRLFVHLLPVVGVPRRPASNHLAGVIACILAKGRDERDSRGMNRFRLVLVAVEEGSKEALGTVGEEAMAALSASGGVDDRVHLHVLSLAALPEDIRPFVWQGTGRR